MSGQDNSLKVGVYVDAAYVYKNGGRGMQYNILREFACREGAQVIRLNAYVSFDADRAHEDAVFGANARKFHSFLRDLGYKVIIKEVKWFVDDETGERFGKANADMDLATDLLIQSEQLDKIVLVSGDGDFVKVVNAAQNRGCRVEVIGFDNVSGRLKEEADQYFSGYMIPNLLPTNTEIPWGQIGSVVRGTCSYFNKEKGFGYLRYLKEISPYLWITDIQRSGSPYGMAYFRAGSLQNAAGVELPSYNHIFEFELLPPQRDDQLPVANNVRLVSVIPY
ncbi:MAG TPA: NYN domain-containing protein [Anaerohalosphaeraceae bacterium]|nr:NYN domain-containing protein [Anaerohalosphaeraceae bacterium]